VCNLPLLLRIVTDKTDSTLPTLDNYHSLVPLDTSQHKSTTAFGYPSWIYKAVSQKNGKLYCLRRLEGFFNQS
jgi:PAB-dependent poly(A)-specific ribonuclease subunit 3